MNLFQRAYAGLNLTPGERAALKLWKGFLLTAVAAGLAAGVQALSASGAIDWRKVAAVAAVAFGTSLAFAFEKYFTAQGDAPLAALAGEVVQSIATHAGPQDTVIPFTAPSQVAVTANSASAVTTSGV